MRRVFPFVCAAVLVDTMFFAAITPLLPTYQDELGLSKTSAGLLSAAYPAGTLLASLPAGWLAGRIGAKATAVTGLALIAATSLVFGHAETIVVLDAARFVQGVGGACTWAGALAWLMGVTPPARRGQAIGSALGAALFGVLLGPVIGGAASETSPELVFSGVGVVATLMVLWALAIPGSDAHRASSWRELGVALHARPLQLAMWVMLLPALTIGALDVLVPLRLDDLGARRPHHRSPVRGGRRHRGPAEPRDGPLVGPARAHAAGPDRPRGHGPDRVDPLAAHHRLAAGRAAAGVGRVARVLLGAGGGDAVRVLGVAGPGPGLRVRDHEPGLGGRAGGRRGRRAARWPT